MDINILNPFRLGVANHVKMSCFMVVASFAVSAFAGEGDPLAPPVDGAVFDPAPNTVTFTIQGCRTDGVRVFPVEFTQGNDGVTGPSGEYFACEDTEFDSSNDDDYTSGNLGKNWQELDLVPYRLIAVNSNSSGPVTYDVLVGADFQKEKFGTTTVGFDQLSEPEVFRYSDGCSDSTIEFGEQYEGGAVTGGADNTLLRHIRIVDQAPNTTCVVEWTARLALGSSAYSGSSLQAYMFETITKSGKRTVPIPDVETPVGFSKTMLATRGSGYVWSVTKSAPTSVNFGDTCRAEFEPAADPERVQIDVSWSKIGPTPAGSVSAETEITISNPASRILQFDVTDVLRTDDGSTVLETRDLTDVECGDDYYDGKVHVEPREEVVCTVEWEVDAGDVAGNRLDDQATALLSDHVYPDQDCADVSCELQASAAADVTLTGEAENDTASIVDTETISNADFSFVVDASSTFPGSIEPGTGFEIFAVDDPNEAVWSSGPVSTSGTATFYKDIYAAGRAQTSASLDDTAVLTMADTLATSSDSKSVAITTDPRVSLTIRKTIDFPLRAGEPGDPDQLEFCFEVEGPSYPDGSEATPCVTFEKPLTGQSPTELTTTLSNMDPGVYSVSEWPVPNGWDPTPVSHPSVDLGATSEATCATEVGFKNDPSGDVIARGVKITHPVTADGSPLAAGWTFALNRVSSGGGLSELETAQTACTGSPEVCAVEFTEPLVWGSYTITEQGQDGWDGISSGDCAFDVTLIDLIDGKTFVCTWTNTQRGDVTVVKETAPTGQDVDFFFSENLTNTGAFVLDGVPGTNEWSTPSNSVVPGSYAVREVDPSPNCTLSDNPCTQDWDLLSVGCVDSDDGGTDSARSVSDPNEAAIELDPGETVTCTFTNQLRGTVTVNKTEDFQSAGEGDWTFEVRQGASASSAGTVLASDTTDAFGEVDFGGGYFVPGDYQLCERNVQAGWVLSLITENPDTYFRLPAPNEDGFCLPFTLDPGEDEVFDLENTPPDNEEEPGIAHTIGFWRNWSGDCTNGNQDDVLGATLPGITLGLMEWSDPIEQSETSRICDAVQILSKRNIDGDNRAFDPAYALASQFLAYLLNVESEAGCEMPAEAARAQELLGDTHPDGVGFDGTDPGATSGKGKKRTAIYVANADKAEWISLASLFDQYNNMETPCFNP